MLLAVLILLSLSVGLQVLVLYKLSVRGFVSAPDEPSTWKVWKASKETINEPVPAKAPASIILPRVPTSPKEIIRENQANGIPTPLKELLKDDTD